MKFPFRRADHNRYSSHDAFSHDTTDSLGYDWSRVADPNIPPKHPARVYLPRTENEVRVAMKEAVARGEELYIRSMGHSSNDLVLVEGGSVLCTERLNYLPDQKAGVEWTVRDHEGRELTPVAPAELTFPAPRGAVLAVVDTENLTLRVPAGAVLADVDNYLEKIGFGLKIIGDNNHITVGGFASVGGISPASHRFGLFVDNVVSFNYVTRKGVLRKNITAAREQDFFGVLTGLGRRGVITELTCELYKVEKKKTIIENRRKRFRDPVEFIEFSNARISNPEPLNYLFHRGMWIDFMLGKKNLLVGQFSSYVRTDQCKCVTCRRNLAYGYLHFLGKWAGRLPSFLELPFRYLGILGIVVFPPRFGSIKDAESFTDRVIDYSVGGPWRMLTLFAPVDKYREMFTRIYERLKSERAKHKVLTNISIYVKPVRSPYLGEKVGVDKGMKRGQVPEGCGNFVELTFLLFMDADKVVAGVLDALVAEVDELCVDKGAYRYMPTQTSRSKSVLKAINPNHDPLPLPP